MPRAVLSANFCSCFLLSLATTGARDTPVRRHDRRLQAQPPDCPGTWELAVGAGHSSGPIEVSSALEEAGACAAAAAEAGAAEAAATTGEKNVVSVQWAGSVLTPEPFLVPNGVELRVIGDGWVSLYEQASGGDAGADAELWEAISDASAAEAEQNGAGLLESSVVSSANGNTSLFVIEPGGALSLSKITLSGAWAGADGGGAVLAEGGEVTGEDVRWTSLSAEGAGGAIFAREGTNVTLAGLHLFQGCSSSTLSGGALSAQNASISFQNDARVFFEGCAAANDGGGVELSESTLTMSEGSRTRFRGCGAADKGGGLYMKLSSATEVAAAATLAFEACTAGDASGAKGGAVCSYQSAFSVGAGAAVAFSNNSSPVGDGGAFYGQATRLHVAGGGAALRFDGNRCGDSGGGLALEWLAADEDTACLDLAEGSAASFEGNSVAEYGGGAYIAGCEVSMAGSDVSFTANTAERAGALYIDEAAVSVSGGMTSFVRNSADRWGGAVFLLDSRTTAGGGLEIYGGLEFTGNVAGRSGGGVYIENGDLTIGGDSGGESVEQVQGGSWVGNTAGYDGGMIAVDGGGVRVVGGFAGSNHAAQRGGVLFGTGESTVVWAGGQSRNNSAAAGGSLYLSSSAVNLTDLSLAGDHTPSGPNVFLASADVRAVNVTLVAPADLDATFALHVDSSSSLRAFGCGFAEWSGDAPTVVSEGSVVMDACDFSGSRTSTLVHASRAVATIRNAILGDNNFDRAGGFNASSLLGVGVAGCASLPAGLGCAAAEECVNAESGMGVLCPAFVEAATGSVFALSDADTPSSASSSAAAALPAVDLSVVAPESSSSPEPWDDAHVFFYPDVVTRELVLRRPATAGQGSGFAGAGGVLWELRRADDDGNDAEVGDGGGGFGLAADEDGAFAGTSPDNFTWTAVPWSGFLVRGQEITIKVVGTPPPPEDPSRPFAVYNGEVTAEFRVVSWTAEAGSTAGSDAAVVDAVFYYCQDGAYWDGGRCVSCAEEMATMVAGEGALECSVPGVTLETLPLAKGYWRGDITQTFVRECLNPSTCVGGRGVDTSSPSTSYDAAVAAPAATTATPAANDAASAFYDETRYCVEGHKGAYCSVCADGYRRFSAGQLCISCAGAWNGEVRAALWALGATAAVALILLVIFLIGGLAALSQLKIKLTCGSKAVVGSSAAVRPARSSRRAAAENFWSRLVRAVPFQKLKILIVVWQILTQFSHLAEVSYPPTYQRFLNMLDIVNFDITSPLNATCLVGNISFHQRLICVTLGPLVVLAFLSFTYVVAMWVHRRGGRRGREDAEARQRAVVRHASAALLVLFLVFSSVSTTVFSTFSCDHVEDLDVLLLRADYSISCDHPDHHFYKAYAALMIFLYPVGIPVLFAVLLLKRRDKINPPLPNLEELYKHPTLAATVSADTAVSGVGSGVDSVTQPLPDTATHAGSGDIEASRNAVPGASTAAARGGCSSKSVVSDGADGERRLPRFGSGGDSHGGGLGPGKDGGDRRSGLFLAAGAGLDREEVLESRAHNPDLQSTRFLWEPYEPDNYYYETVECGRRCLLTGALVFVLPNTAGQAAGACIFAFISLLAFELLRPHLSRTDAWMYRVGCIVVFFSNFLALMAKADVSDEKAESQETFGLLLIAVHASMVIAVIAQVYLSMQATSESRDDFLESLLKKDTRGNPCAPNGTGNGTGTGRGGVALEREISSSSSARLPELDANDDGGGRERAGHAIMIKGDTVEDRSLRISSSGRDDVEGLAKRSWGRHCSNSSFDVEDSMELGSVYSGRSKKTSLIAGSIAGNIGLPSSMNKRSSSGAVGGHRRAHHGRALSVSSLEPGGPLARFTLSPRTGHALRRSATGGDALGFGGDDDGSRRRNRRPESSGMSLSSSLSPIRQVRRDGDRPFRTICARAASERHQGLTAASSAVPDSHAQGGDGGGGVGGDEDTTAAKLERLYSLSAGLDAAPAPPAPAATVRSNRQSHVLRRLSPPRCTASSAATPVSPGLLDPPPAAPKLAATVNTVSEVGIGRQSRQQRKKIKPLAVGATSEEIGNAQCSKRGGSRRRPERNGGEELDISEMKLV